MMDTIIVTENGHTNRLVDVTNWPDYPGEWPARRMTRADMDAINRVLETEAWDLATCPSRFCATREDYAVAARHGFVDGGAFSAAARRAHTRDEGRFS